MRFRILAVAALAAFSAVFVAPGIATADTTHGDLSPQGSLVTDSLNKPCLGIPVKANIQNIIGLVNIGIQDIPILSAPQTQQCVDNSTQANGDEPISHILDDIPVLSSNGVSNE
ncbi:rodlin [Streptomyces sp. NPDC050636]|uniref:rodlin n=1 Tax=Streptomyces sp. NPDC050636 TaxID=3154510 RepID=UPI00341EFC59